jgi:hypothetical protein
MTGPMSFRALMDTKPTLKWFIIIGLIIVIFGVLLSFISVLGVIIAWIGFFLIGLSVIALIYLWLTERYLPQPTMDRVSIQR